jgi:PAS domain S-box-containing protein
MTTEQTVAPAYSNWRQSPRLTPYAWAFALALYCLLIFGGLLSHRAEVVLTNAAWTAASLIATLAAWRTSRHVQGERRRVWRLFAAACGAWCCGQLVWDWQVLVLRVDRPFPGLADVGYTAYAFLFIAGLLRYQRLRPARRLAPARAANLSLILCSLAVVLNRMLVQPLLATEQPSVVVSVALVESLSVTAAFIVAVYSLWSYRWLEDLRPMLLISVGLTVHGLVALIYAHRVLLSYESMHLVNVGWIVAFALQHWAAQEQTRSLSEHRPIARAYLGEGSIEAIMPGVLLLVIAATRLMTAGLPTMQTTVVEVTLLTVFAMVLITRETWMYSQGRQLRTRLEHVQTTLDHAEGELSRTAEKHSDLQRNIESLARAGGVGLWDWNLRTDEVSYSTEWKQQLGYADDEVGRTSAEWRDRLHPDDVEAALRTLDRFLSNPSGEFVLETRVRHRDGSYRWILSRASLVRDQAGEPLRMLGSHVDITPQKELEAALRDSESRYRRLAEELEHRVADRTVELSDAYRDSRSFAYAVAHDLRAPLRAINSFAQLLRESAEPRLTPAEVDHVNRVTGGALQMARLIDGLLAYSRVEHADVRLEPVELQSFVREVLDSFASVIAAQHVLIAADIPAVHVCADREGLRIVLRNLIENALKFTRGVENARVDIGASRRDERVLIWVKDNGIGFEQQYHDKMFEIFERVHRDQTLEGTGIGLALARKAVQRMRGRIWAESAPDRGAAFYVELATECVD